MKPNIVLAVMDTARAQYVHELIESRGGNSAVGQLAADGVRYSSAYSTSPWTLPSHASMFTGVYPSEHGTTAENMTLRDDLPTLAGELSSRGYRTGCFTNNPWITDTFGMTRGFDDVFKVWQYIQSDVDFGEISVREMGFEKVKRGIEALFSGNTGVNLVNAIYGQFLYRRHDYGARRTNKLATEWVDETGESPFFMFLNYLEPHLEYRPDKEYAELYLPPEWDYQPAMDIPQDAWAHVVGERRLSEAELEALSALYRAEIEYLDDRIGEVIDHLKRTGRWENTIFVLCGDHGENIGEYGLMDHQYSLYNTLLHVPLIVSGGAFDGGDVVDDPVQLCDLFPTLLDAAEIDRPPVHSQSFHPNSSEPTRESVYAEYSSPQPPISALEDRFGELPEDVYKYDRGLRSIQTDQHKLIVGTDGSEALYEIEFGGYEDEDISKSSDGQTVRLRAKLDEWLDSFEHHGSDDEREMDSSVQDRLERLGYLQ